MRKTIVCIKEKNDKYIAVEQRLKVLSVNNIPHVFYMWDEIKNSTGLVIDAWQIDLSPKNDIHFSIHQFIPQIFLIISPTNIFNIKTKKHVFITTFPSTTKDSIHKFCYAFMKFEDNHNFY